MCLEVVGYTTGTDRQGAFKDSLGGGGAWVGKERQMGLTAFLEPSVWTLKNRKKGRSFSMFIFPREAFGAMLNKKGAGPLLICQWEVVMAIAKGE
jgi:hypothetical protein